MAVLLELCQTALREMGPIAVPSSIVGNNNPTAVLLLANANRVGKELALDFKWQELLKTHSFTTVNGTADYALPSDLDSFANLTHWDNTNLRRVRGPVSPVLWQALQSSNLVGLDFDKFFRIANSLYSIYPTPTAAEEIEYQFYTKNWITGKSAFSDDADVPLIDNDIFILGLKYYFRRAKGLVYDEEKADYYKKRDALQSKNGGKDILNFGKPPMNWSGNIPETNYGS